MTLPEMTDYEAARFMLAFPWALSDTDDDNEVSYSATEIEGVLDRVHKINARVETAEMEVTRLRAELEEIKALVSWHMDTEADPSNESPEDMTAHINGLVWQLCQQA